MTEEVKIWVDSRIFQSIPNISTLLIREIRILEAKNPTKQFITQDILLRNVEKNEKPYICVNVIGNLVKIPKIIKKKYRKERLRLIKSIPTKTEQILPTIQRHRDSARRRKVKYYPPIGGTGSSISLIF